MINDKTISWPGWETVQLIGRGSFGAVYEIQREMFGDIEKAALKVITIPQNCSDIEEMYSDGYDEESITNTFRSHLRNIVAEYSLMRKMNGYTNIVNCDDVRYVQHDDGIGWDIFIKMELLTPLSKALPEKITEELVIKIAKDMCCALELCRKYEIVHRDIKPQNIFVSPNGDYKLGDFGIAKTVEKTMGGTKIGTYKYMAPEVYNNEPYGSGADIYSLGLVLYWLLNERRMPFLPLPPEKLKEGMDESARNRRLAGEPIPAPAHGSQGLKRIVLKACAYDVKDRYVSATELLADLSEISGAVAPLVSGNQAFETIKQQENASMEEKTVSIYQMAVGKKKEEISDNVELEERPTGLAETFSKTVVGDDEQDEERTVGIFKFIKEAECEKMVVQAEVEATLFNKVEHENQEDSNEELMKKEHERKIHSNFNDATESKEIIKNDLDNKKIEKKVVKRNNEEQNIVNTKSTRNGDKSKKYVGLIVIILIISLFGFALLILGSKKEKSRGDNVVSSISLDASNKGTISNGEVGKSTDVIEEQFDDTVEKLEDENAPKKFVDVCLPYELKSSTVFTTTGSFAMGGISYKDGITMEVWEPGAWFLSNLNGKYAEMKFELGHVDKSGLTNVDLHIYLDDVLYSTVKVISKDLPIEVCIPVTGVKKLKIMAELGGDYEGYPTIGLGNIMICTKAGFELKGVNNTSNSTSDFMVACLPYEVKDACLHTGNSNFMMGGEKYRNGITLEVWEPGAWFISNLGGRYTEFRFDLGHVDKTGMTNVDVLVYLDGELYDIYTVVASDLPIEISIPVVGIQQLKVMAEMSSDYDGYPTIGFGNMTVK